MVVIACWHLALAGSAPNLISLNSPTLAAAEAMAEKFCVYNEEQYPRSHLSGECGMLWVRAPSVSYADALSNNSKLENRNMAFDTDSNSITDEGYAVFTHIP